MNGYATLIVVVIGITAFMTSGLTLIGVYALESKKKGKEAWQDYQNHNPIFLTAKHWNILLQIAEAHPDYPNCQKMSFYLRRLIELTSELNHETYREVLELENLIDRQKLIHEFYDHLLAHREKNTHLYQIAKDTIGIFCQTIQLREDSATYEKDRYDLGVWAEQLLDNWPSVSTEPPNPEEDNSVKIQLDKG